MASLLGYVLGLGTNISGWGISVLKLKRDSQSAGSFRGGGGGAGAPISPGRMVSVTFNFINYHDYMNLQVLILYVLQALKI